MKDLHQSAYRRPSGLALMEILVLAAIIIAVAAIAVPIYKLWEMHSYRDKALKQMRDLGGAAMNYASAHDGQLPAEDAPGATSWEAASEKKNDEVWFNALPRQMGKKGVGDFKDSPASFYSAQNPIWVEGAEYPKSEKRLVRPYFGISFNSKLERKSVTGDKLVRLSNIPNPARTVLLLTEGLPKENNLEIQPKFDGQAKGSARSFVGRYGGKGYLVFCDGNVEPVKPHDTLDVTGQIIEPQTNFIWSIQSPTETAAEGPKTAN